MKIRKGDNVIVKVGADRGKTGKILHVYPSIGKVLIEGVNIKKKHQKSRRAGQKGQMIEKPSPVHHSNVMLVDPKKNVGTRIGISREGGKVIRIARKSGAIIEE